MNAHSLTSSLLDEVGNDHISQTHLAELSKRYPYFVVPKVCYALHEKNPQKLRQELTGYNVNAVRYALLHHNTLHLKPSFIDIESRELMNEDAATTATQPIQRLPQEKQVVNEQLDHSNLAEPNESPEDNIVKDEISTESEGDTPEAKAENIEQTEFDSLQLGATDYFSSKELLAAGDTPKPATEKQPSIATPVDNTSNEEKFLLVQMSFGEWLKHITKKNAAAKEEVQEQKQLKWEWQQQKLAAAIQEEGDEIPEDVFKMAIDSIASEEHIASESMAKVYLGQGKGSKAIEIYRKLILQNPEKKVYFADQIEQIQKDIHK